MFCRLVILSTAARGDSTFDDFMNTYIHEYDTHIYMIYVFIYIFMNMIGVCNHIISIDCRLVILSTAARGDSTFDDDDDDDVYL
jgi:hypothetical protein